jgi:FkbM family methyltransferase
VAPIKDRLGEPSESFDNLVLPFSIESNLSTIERVFTSKLRRLLYDSSDFINYVRAFRNFPTVIVKGTLLRSFPLEMHLRNPGVSVLAQGLREVFLYSYLGKRWRRGTSTHVLANLTIDSEGTVRFDLANRVRSTSVTLCGMNKDGDLAIFTDSVYSGLTVRGRTVIDIGASSGDSALLFALGGAKKIVAVEPSTSAFSSLCRNIAKNHLTEIVLPLKAALAPCCSRTTHPWLPEQAARANAVRMEPDFIALECLTRQFACSDSVLKVDCEGHEYASILTSSTEVLRRFSEIVIEYHYGYRNLARKLKEAGFTVRTTSPAYSRKSTSGSPAMFSGMLVALKS